MGIQYPSHATSGPSHADHLLCHVERLGREHRSEDAHNEVEALVPARSSHTHRLLDLSREALSFARLFPARQVPRDIYAQHVAPSFASGSAVVPSPQPRSKTLRPFVTPCLYERLAALSHALRDAGKVAFSPRACLDWPV